MNRIGWIVLILLVTLRYTSTRPKYSEGDSVRISGRVATEPIRYSESQYFRLVSLKVYLPLYPEISYGDSLILEGVVEEDKLKKPTLINLEKSDGVLYVFRKRLISFYQKALPEPHAALVAGITLGAKSSLPANFWEALKSTGTAHVVVASGMNVAMTASFLLAILLRIVTRKKAVLIAIVMIWIYTVISGFDAPIVRAAIMGSIAFSAQAFGRLASTVRILFISALLMLLINPDWITDLGFILSFLATLSLILFEGKVNRLIWFVPRILREGLSTSFAAQIGVAPVLYIVFGQFNLLSPFINALILWTIAPIMIISALGGLVGLIIPIIGMFICFIVLPLTTWFIWVIDLLG